MTNEERDRGELRANRGGNTTEPKDQFPLALDPPEGPAVLFDEALILRALEGSRSSPRKRIILPLHLDDDEVLNRMLNAVQPGSYVRPHRHTSPPKAESLVVLRGSFGFFTFEDDGEIKTASIIGAGSQVVGIDVRPKVFHTFIALQEDSVVFEVKPGPYVKMLDKDFAAWAPAEFSSGVEEYLAKLSGSL